MSLIDWMLNLAGLILWLGWRNSSPVGKRRPSGISIAATVKQMETARPRTWLLPLCLLALITLRSFFYWHIGSALDWTPRLPLAVVVLPFRSDFFSRIFLFSFLSFALFLATFYFGLFLLSAVNRSIPDSDPVQRWLRTQLGWVEKAPAAVLMIMPILLSGVAWAALSPLLVWMGLLPQPASGAHLMQQAIVVGLGSILVWKYLLVALLVLRIANDYVFLGDLAFWRFVNATSHNLLRPISWLPLRMARADFAPVAAVILVMVLFELGGHGLSHLYRRLPL
jgi:uncharacterized protein YggT (Ycf19 family)